MSLAMAGDPTSLRFSPGFVARTRRGVWIVAARNEAPGGILGQAVEPIRARSRKRW